MKQRYLSLDIFRGMTIAFMVLVNTPGSWDYVYPPLLHARWHGCTPTDWVFPSFMFIIGVAMRFSFKPFDYKLSTELSKKILKRTFLIYIVYVLMVLYPFYDISTKTFTNFRILGVLPRIALGYCAASFIVLSTKKQYLPYITAAILLGYWAVLWLFGEPGMQYEMLTSFAQKVDLAILTPNHLYKGEGTPFDPEGLLSTIPSIGTILLGYIAGTFIQEKTDKKEVIIQFIIFGIAALVVAWIWNFVFPINKKIWTSSYVVYMAGVDLLILAALIWLIDIKGWVKWSNFFHVFGMNSIIAYIIGGLYAETLYKVKFMNAENTETSLYTYLYEKGFQPFFGNYFGSFLFAVMAVVFTWAIAYWMYRKKIFIKL